MRSRAALALLLPLALAGCTAGGVGTSNFDLLPQKVGWFAGEEAHFVLEISSSLLARDPTFTVDRRFAIEEIRFNEKGVTFGGDYETRDPDAVGLRLARANATVQEHTLTAEAPSLDVFVTIPPELRDSEYVLEIKLFNVGWVESETFRVDHA